MDTKVNGAISDALDSRAHFVKIVGGGGTGKTHALALFVRELFERGVGAADVLVLCSTCSAADQFAKLLRKQALSELPQVSTVAQCCIGILASPDARKATRRNPRVLADFEERILMEDMKVCGLKPKRLREMLKFFYKEISELGDEKEDFILDSEEADVYDTLLANLRLRNAVLPQELSNLAYKYVRDHADAAACSTRRFVLVDDYQNLSVASQLLAEKLAGECLIIAGCVNEQVTTSEFYPAPDKFRTFEMAHEGTHRIELLASRRTPDRITAMANALVVNGGLSKSELVELSNDASCEVRFVKWTHPNDEFMGIARYIKHRLNDADHPIRAKDIFVAVPNATWGRAIGKVLKANHIKVDQVLSHHAIKGDPRSLEKSTVMQAFTRLNLAAEPDDAAAWRNWCGFGDFLTNSNHWFRLEKYAQKFDLDVLEVLERAELVTDGELFSGSGVLVERYRAGKEFVGKAQGKQGFALLNLCAPVAGDKPPQGLMDLVEPVEGAETAADLLERARSRMEMRFADEDAVRIGLMEMSCGMSFDTVIFTGAIEGFFPALATMGIENDDERNAEIRMHERREWYAAMTKARHAFIVSTVCKDEANTAAALGMHVHRIRMEDGKSMAILSPTPYVEEMGAEAPGFEAVI